MKSKGLMERLRDRESLAGADLRFLWFAHWNFQGRNLRKANLRGAHLKAADLSGADLREAVLEGANLTGARLCGAMLMGAELTDALVAGADFREASGLSRETLRILQAHGAVV